MARSETEIVDQKSERHTDRDRQPETCATRFSEFNNSQPPTSFGPLI